MLQMPDAKAAPVAAPVRTI